MKITKQYLIGVIKEELSKTLNEAIEGHDGPRINYKRENRNRPDSDFGEPGGLDSEKPDVWESWDGDMSKLIDTMLRRGSDFALAQIDKYNELVEISIPEALALYAIAKKLPDNPEVMDAYASKIEGHGARFKALDFLTIGGGDVNRKKLLELLPKLMSHFN